MPRVQQFSNLSSVGVLKPTSARPAMACPSRGRPVGLGRIAQALRVEVGRDVADLRLGRGAIALTWLKATVVARVLRS
jgi:hypothetical protein